MEAAGQRWIVHPSRSDEITIWNLADLHWLSRACAEKHVRKDIKAIQDDPNSFWVGGGDYADFIGFTDKRFDPDAVAPWVSVKNLGNLGVFGMTCVRDLFLPIKDRCLGLVVGNHEKKYALKTEHEGLHGWLCTELGVPSLEYSALLDVIFWRKSSVKSPRLAWETPGGSGDTRTVRLFIHHGAGYAQTPGGKLNRLVQFMQSFEADVFFCGHVHDRVGRREPTIGGNTDCTELEAHERVGVISGSYLKTYAQGVTTYGEQRGYRPVSLGAAWVRIRPQTGQIFAEI